MQQGSVYRVCCVTQTGCCSQHETCAEPGEQLSSLLWLVAGAQAMEARRIYAAMKDSLCRPDALTLTSLATAYQRAGKWDWAEQVVPCKSLLYRQMALCLLAL